MPLAHDPPRVLTDPQAIMAHLRECHDAKPSPRWLLCAHPGRMGDFQRFLDVLHLIGIPGNGSVMGRCLIQVTSLMPTEFACCSIPRDNLPFGLLRELVRYMCGAELEGDSLAVVFAHPGEPHAFLVSVLNASLNPETVEFYDRPDPSIN